MSLLLSLTSAVCIVVTALITHRIGYLAGKAEVSDALRGEPLGEDIAKELRACGRGE